MSDTEKPKFNIECDHPNVTQGDCMDCGETVECQHFEWEDGHCMDCGIYMGEIFDADDFKDRMQDDAMFGDDK